MRRKRNLENLANCPFCGNHELELEDSTGDITCNACAYTFYDTSEDNVWWNSRPIEDQLKAEIERLQEERRWLLIEEATDLERGFYLYEDVRGNHGIGCFPFDRDRVNFFDAVKIYTMKLYPPHMKPPKEKE